MKLILVEAIPLLFEGGPAEVDEYLLSPYVYAGGRAIAVRAVPRRDDEPQQKISRAFRGRSTDGVSFILEAAPMLAPSEDADRGGVEDPTVVEVGDTLHVFYSGWDPIAQRSTLLRATSTRTGACTKRGRVFGGPHPPQAKEATLLRTTEGWTMFFEIEGDASLNASARATSIEGPWTFGDPVLTVRREYFDSANLSPVAFVTAPNGEHVLIYNGADASARWQVGWCTLDASCSRVLERCEAPIIAASRNTPEHRELAFAASAIARDGLLDIYYSVADADSMRATFDWHAVT